MVDMYPEAEAALFPVHSSSTGMPPVCTYKIHRELGAKPPGTRQTHCSAGQYEEPDGSTCSVSLPHVMATSNVPLYDTSL